SKKREKFQEKSVSIRPRVAGETVFRLPQLDLDHRKTLAGSEVKDQLGNVFGRWVNVQHKHRLALMAQQRQHRVVAVQQHLVVERLVDPRAHHGFHAGKVHDHAEVVKARRGERQDGATVVPVQVAALAVVIEQAVAVAEVDLARHAEHGASQWYGVASARPAS